MQGAFPWFLDALLSGPAGIQEAPWFVYRTAPCHHIILTPYRFTNITSTFRPASSSRAFDIIQSSSAVASHAWGSLYALQNGSLEEFAFDANFAWFRKGTVLAS